MGCRPFTENCPPNTDYFLANPHNHSASSQMMWQQSIPFTPDTSAETLANLPETAAVFLLSSDELNAEPYISKAANLRRRLERLLSAAPPNSKRLNLRERTRRIEYTQTGSDFENRLLVYKALREHFPRSY